MRRFVELRVSSFLNRLPPRQTSDIHQNGEAWLAKSQLETEIDPAPSKLQIPHEDPSAVVRPTAPSSTRSTDPLFCPAVLAQAPSPTHRRVRLDVPPRNEAPKSVRVA